MAGRNGSRKQSPPRPEDISLHWARVSKLQDTTAEVTSLRQYSPADAGVAIATKASALSAVMGAALNFKSCFIFLSPCFLCDGYSPAIEMGCAGSSRHPRRKKAMEFSVLPNRSENAPRRGRIEV